MHISTLKKPEQGVGGGDFHTSETPAFCRAGPSTAPVSETTGYYRSHAGLCSIASLLCSATGTKIQIIKGWMWVIIPGKPFTSISTVGYLSERGDPFLYNSTKCWSIYFWGYCLFSREFYCVSGCKNAKYQHNERSPQSTYLNATSCKSEEIIKSWLWPRKQNHSTHFTSYKNVFKWNLIVRATSSTQHSFFYLSRGQNNNTTARKPFPWHGSCLHEPPLAIIFCTFRDTSRGQQHKDIQGKLLGSSAGYCTDCLNVSGENQVWVIQKEVVIDWDILFPKGTPSCGARKHHLSCNNPDILKTLKFPSGYRQVDFSQGTGFQGLSFDHFF